MKEIKTNDGKKGGWLVGKRHYDKSGKSLGGIKAVVTDAGGKPVELEGGEVIINREASKKYWKELSRINQSAGNGVAIGPPSGFDEDPEDNYENGGKIDFNPNHIPNKWILSYAEKIKANHPEIWKLGGNIFGNEAFNNLKRVADRGHWLDSEEWMYIKWRAYVARHIHDFRIEGVVAMLKWVDKVEKGWPYMKQLIEEKIKKIESKKKGWKHKTTKMKTGGIANDSNSLTVTKYILNRHPKKDDIFQGGKVDGYKIIKIKKLKKDFGIVYHIFILDTKKNAEGKFNKRIISYRPESKKITDFLESNLTATKGTYYTQWDDSELQSKMKTGGSVAQTPAPKKDQIKGSDVNKSGSSATTKSASSIKFDEKTIESINNKVKDHNDAHPDKKITLASAKAVVRRGMGAYSSSHRPTITGGQPNSRVAWGIARLNAFTYKIVHGKSKSDKYTQDDDLIEEFGYSVAKYHLGGDMSKHLAPNGKPSNLTHEQWHLVRTPEFKAWFGDWENDPANASKVVDENGEPLVVYRGMPKKRKFGNVFKYNVNLFGKTGIGGRQTNTFAFYFTDSKEVAEDYGKNLDEEDFVIKSYFLNIKNLFKAFQKRNQTKIIFSELYDLANYTGQPVLEKYADNFGKKDEWLDVYSDQRRNYNFNKESLPIYSFFVDWSKNDGNQDFWRVYLDNLLGYNGLVFYEDTHNYDYVDSKLVLRNEEISKTFGVFEPTQIKLADGTNTTFDGDNPDIRFERGGQTEKQHGDCYVVAGKIAMGSKKIDFIGTPYLVHAQVEGQGTIKGIKYGHAWVEDDIFVYDYSNGRELVVPKKLYYAMGNIKQIKPQYYKYTFNDAMTKMIETQHYGSWDLQTESGL